MTGPADLPDDLAPGTLGGMDASVDTSSLGGGERLVLIGFMGAGKTTLARRWAECGGPALWFDSDAATLAALGVDSVSEAFELHGEAGFRAAEREQVLRRAAVPDAGLDVWSLGGGAPCDDEVAAAIEGSCVVWLDVPPDVAWERVAGSDRPLARDLDAFRERWEQRRERYARLATVRVDATRPLEELGLGRVLADHMPAAWFGSGLAVGAGMLERIDDIAALRGRELAIVADRRVDDVADRLVERLRAAGMPVESDLRLAMGEFNKQLATVERVLRGWAAAGLHRRSTVLALGGGTTLDTVGFAASIYQRGLDWVSIPTTATSQVDAGIGGKTGVNLGTAKNVVGSVHQPRATVVDVRALETLSDEALRDGFVEAAKTALLRGGALLEAVEELSRAPAGERQEPWRRVVAGSAAYKDLVVADDPFDTDGVRAQLNLGHTLGHAIESATGGAISHGAAVAVGIHAALRLSVLAAGAPAELVERWLGLCERMGIVTGSPLSFADLEPYLALDKKRDERGIGWVLLRDVGAPVTGVRLPVDAARHAWETHVRIDLGGARRLRPAGRAPRVLVLFGANLGELGHRDAEHYGARTLPELVHDIEAWAAGRGLVADCRQTDSLERFLHALHEARDAHDAVLVNPGAWTHHEHAIHDALESLDMPRVEVHLSQVSEREAWRRTSVVAPACDHHVAGAGAAGFEQALAWVAGRLDEGDATGMDDRAALDG